MRTITHIQNNSGHKVSIIPYKSGTIVLSDTFSIDNMSEKTVVKEGRIVPSYALELSFLSDSVLVVFDGKYQVSHYALETEGNNPRAYAISHLRNVLNPKSYQFNRTKVSKRVTQFEYVYTFTLQDYLDAQ